LNVEVGASDGGTGPKTIGPTGLTIQPWGTWSASRTPCNVSVPEAVSLTRTRATRPGRMVEGARTTTWRAAGVLAIVNAPRSGRPASAEESPT